METFRQVVTVSSDHRKIEVTLPNTIPPGKVEVVLVVQPISDQSGSASLPDVVNLFGFLPKRVDPLQFERQIRDEWSQ
ncbi:MAG: hypothetical protein F6K00_32830 [Leptolyngbya sp. SIOISBB]|nr:hypothetical protein [Leptolyngbya sp. SIOISBB]